MRKPATALVLGLTVTAGAAGPLPPVVGQGFQRLAMPPGDIQVWEHATVIGQGPHAGGAFLLSGPPIGAGDLWVGAVLPTQSGYADPIVGPGPGTLGAFTRRLGTGDFTGDGVQDLFAWSESGGTVYAVPFDGGSFDTPVDLGLSGFGPDRARHFADLDGDGRADVAVRLPGDRLGVRWSSRADVAAAEYDIGAPFRIEAMADFTGNGHADILLSGHCSHEIRIIPGTGTDAFGQTIVITPAIAEPVAGIADLTGDGLPDIVLAGSAAMTVLVNQSGGQFAPTTVPAPDGVGAVLPIGDIDGDGVPDVIVETTRFPGLDRLRWVWRNPLAGYDREELWLVQQRPDAVLVRDMNQDGLPDLVSFSGFAVTTDFQSAAPDGPRLGAKALRVRRNPTHVLPVDLDANGVPELIVTGQIAPNLYRRGADGAYTEEDLSGGPAFMSLAADFNANGRTDLVVSSGGRTVGFLAGGPGGTLGAIQTATLPEGAQTLQIAVADLDGDGLPDVVAADAGLSEVHVFLGRTDGMPTLEASIPLASASGAIAAIDLDGDGVYEIVAGDGTALRVIRHGPNGWEPAESIAVGVTPTWLTVADLDADGHDDLIVGAPSGAFTLRAYFGTGDGLGVDPEYFSPLMGQVLETAAGDLTGNGLADIVVARAGAKSPPALFVQTDARQFVYAGVLPTEPATGVAVADLDSDGVPDTAAVSATFQQGMLYTVLSAPAPCQADLTGDGQLNFFDVAAFVALFNAGDPAADFNKDGELNFFDFAAYLNTFNAGCP